jgi:excisionase family DNA binding protein
MEKHELLSGRTIEFDLGTKELAGFVASAREQLKDPKVKSPQFMALVLGPDNPLREKKKDALRRDPVYLLLLDLFDRKRLMEGKLNLDNTMARYTMTVKEAAAELGMAPSSVRRAISSNRLGAWRFKGGFRLSPEQVETYKNNMSR